MPEGGDLGGDVLCLAEEVRRADAIGEKRLRQLEEENGKLKRLLADAMLDVSTLREMLGKNF